MGATPTMKAVVYTKYGGAEVTTLATLPRPTAGPGEVLVAVAAAALNPVDVYLRNGLMAQITPNAFPQIAANELAGTVVALGAGVASFAVGDRVMARVSKTHTGAVAQFVSVPAGYAARAPASISLAAASGFPLCALTAAQMLDKLSVSAGDRLLVAGGATVVGQYGIQLAKMRGATVVATASPAGEPLVRRLGVDEIIDYKSTTLTGWAASNGAFDKLFDAAGPRDDVSDLLGAAADGAHIVTVSGPNNPGSFDAYVPWWKRWVVNGVLWSRFRATCALASARGLRYEYMFMNPDGAQLGELGRLVDEGKLEVPL
ncbi:Reticulon-4-interacting protein 1, mitochondrial [Vanrija pseudolonga]|uniref:Reticulon-4-interacting protein 1, mitochondrial n=1 Tax=Vanrija pseudolonga TaxID=143232 RepID=A0AAF0YE43_9TREE|nr:Reticulon-4-interacting protein 1, mitochondrial [Vanrija pseudolonga]